MNKSYCDFPGCDEECEPGRNGRSREIFVGGQEVTVYVQATRVKDQKISELCNKCLYEIIKQERSG